MRTAARTVVMFVALISATVSTATAQEQNPSIDQSLFPRPPQLTDAVRFWTRVYTEVDTGSGFIHDSRNLGVVYETVRFGKDASSRQRRRATTRASDNYRDILNKLATNDRGNLSTDEARVLALWPAGTSSDEFKQAAGRIRFQLGQSDRYRAGLERSGQWKPYILSVLEAEGLPAELAALPHVESSFDPTAYSKVGAAGMWQFTRSTGLRYMQIDHIIDERRDPFLSTDAAARLLKDNYAVIESWPLALTAYNHGLAGMRRAASQQKTKDIGVIVENYTSRTFGFASRNFYAAFLAALDVDTNAEQYFGQFSSSAPADELVVELSDYIDAAPLAQALRITVRQLQALNPALMDTVWAGDKFIPRGFPLRVPTSVGSAAASLVDTIPAGQRYAQQRPDLYHRVQRGETLSGIAERYGLGLSALVRANGMNNQNFIRVGQQLTLPIANRQAVPTLTAAVADVASSGEYIVRRGDSIERIARRFGVDQAELLRVNDVRNRNLISAGEVLKIPSANAEREAIVADARVAAVADARVAPLRPEAALAATQPVPTATPEPAAIEPTLIEARVANQPALETPADEVAAIASEDGEADLESNLLASTQARLAADPSDYSVAADSTIEVQDMETLGHYADWLEIRTQRLRDINGMPFEQPVVYGQRIKLDFSNVDQALFEARRTAYQEQRQESFFLAYHIADTVDHVIRSGDSLWLLAQRTYNVPVWLLRQYNPDLDLDRIRPGNVVKFPRLEPIAPSTEELASVSAERELG